MKKLLKKIVPSFIFSWYHFILAKLAAFVFGHPSDKMIVVGVTGTKGKTTTCNMIASVLEASGKKVGLATTANFKIAEKEWLNDKKMTMLGRFALQKLLKRMVVAGCTYAIIETSSEGIKQYRNVGINYDLAVFTNLSPEHLEAHGTFENYKAAKGKLFSGLAAGKNKKLGPQFIGGIPKTIIVNADDELAGYFLSFKAERKLKYALDELSCDTSDEIGDSTEMCLVPHNLEVKSTGTFFSYDDQKFNLKLLGKFNVYNALAAITVGLALNIPLEKIRQGLNNLKTVPGRMEFIENEKGITVIVDYAHEPKSIKSVYSAICNFKEPDSKIIGVTGSAGGGRDKARRPVLGRLANRFCDIVIVTNEDPYDENPEEIIDQVLAGVLEDSNRELNKNVFKILDRKEAIQKAIELARPHDLVILTGKGAEQWIMGNNGSKIPWDERSVVREILVK